MSCWTVPATWLIVLASATSQTAENCSAAAVFPPGAGEGLLGACRLSGSVVVEPDGREFLKLEVKLEFRTDADNTLVPIGFKGARLIHAALDKETPIWGPETEGFSVLVPRARDYHQLELTMMTPVIRTGAERRVVIDRIPKSAITTLDWQVPNRRTTVLVPAHPFEERWAELTLFETVVRNSAVVKGIGGLRLTPAEGGSRLQADALGVIDHLEASWSMGLAGTELKDAAAVFGEMTVVVNERDRTLDTSALLRVECRTGSVQKLVFRLAADALVSQVAPVENEPKGPPLKWKFDADQRLLTVHLPQPLRANQPATTLRVHFDQKISTRANAGLNVGQLALVEPMATLETGTITVLSRQRVSFVRQQVRPIPPRERPATDPRHTACAFAYSSQPAELRLLFDPPPAAPAVVEIRPRVQLSFPISGDIVFEAQFDITRLHRGELEQIEFHWPPEWGLEPAENPPGVHVSEASGGVVRVRFEPPVSSTAEVRLAGRQRAAEKVQVNLPCPQVAVGVHGKLQLHIVPGELRLLPGEAKVWVGAASSGISGENPRIDGPGPLTGPATFILNPPNPQVPWRLSLNVQPRRHEVKVHAQVFVTQSEWQVRQRLAFRFVKNAAAAAPGTIIVRVPEEIEAALEARLALNRGDRRIEGAIPLFDRPGSRGNGWVEKEIALPREPEAQSGCEILFSYRRRYDAGQHLLAVPLVIPGNGYALTGPAEAQIWTSADVRVRPADEVGWQGALNLAVGSRRGLPQLQMRSLDAANALVLVVAALPDAIEPDLIVGRTLIEVSQTAAGQLRYRARFHLAQISTCRLRILLPGPATTLEGILHDQQQVPQPQLSWTETADGILLTIDLEPHMLAQDMLLDLRFRIDPRGIARWGAVYDYPAPRLEGRVSVENVRWRIEASADQMLLMASATAAPGQGYRWQSLPWPGLGWLGFIAAPRAAASPASWEDWIGGGQTLEAPRHGYGLMQTGAVVPVRLVLVPRMAWLFFCSLALVGGGIFWQGRKPRRPLWGLAAILLPAAILVLIAPSLALAILFGMQPGVLVLGTFLVAMWVWRLHWRRRITWLPGFQRLKVDGPAVPSGWEQPPAGLPHTEARRSELPASVEAGQH